MHDCLFCARELGAFGSYPDLMSNQLRQGNTNKITWNIPRTSQTHLVLVIFWWEGVLSKSLINSCLKLLSFFAYKILVFLFSIIQKLSWKRLFMEKLQRVMSINGITIFYSECFRSTKTGNSLSIGQRS